jgi:hypothetical protein
VDATSRLVGVTVLLIGVSVVAIFRSGVVRSLHRFFTAPGSAYDLAFFRLFFFPLALRSTDVRLGSAEHLARLPRFMLIHPRGMGWAIHYLPMSPGLVRVAFTVATIAAVAAALGVRTRLSSGVFLIAAGYYLTVGYMFGTGGHFHDVLWVAAILTVSRSGDVLSVDAALAARRNARRGESLEAPEPHVRYALPLRMIWLLLGSIYFFPGLFKYLHAGLGWASPANIRAEIYWKMPLYPGWTPPFNPWHYDGLLRTAGLGTMLFELSFVFLTISPRTRPIAAFCGIAFHNVTNLLMRIPFWSLQLVYVSFIPWARLCDRLWSRRGRLVFAYPGHSMRTTQTAAVLRVLALPGAIEAAAGPDPDSHGRISGEEPHAHVDVADNVRVLHGNDSFVGFDAYRASRAESPSRGPSFRCSTSRRPRSWGAGGTREPRPRRNRRLRHDRRRSPNSFRPGTEASCPSRSSDRCSSVEWSTQQ